MKKLFLTLCLAAPLLASAEVTPPHGPHDARVRFVDYNGAQVVRLVTFFGVSTHVQFGESEAIKDIALGDQEGWTVRQRVNHLFLKPKAENADTNLTVITDKRVYHFALLVHGRKVTDPAAWRDPDLTYSLSFRYPDEVAKLRAAEQDAAKDNKAAEDIEGRLTAAKARTDGTDYWLAGADEVSPSAVRDDGRFMYLTFGNNRDMPAVYAEDLEGKEALVNTHVEGNQIVVQRLFRKLVLRKGGAVACLVNKSFDLNAGTDNTSGTVAPDVVRAVKGDKR